MNKKKFIKKQAVNSELAEAAWEEAGGDASRAKKLLQPVSVCLKGRFQASGRSGLWYFDWNAARNRLNDTDVVVLSKKTKGTSPRLSPKAFKKNLQKAQRSSDKLSGPINKLNSRLEKLLEDESSKVVEALKDQEYDKIPPVMRTVVADTLGFDLTTNEVHYTLRRKIDKLDDEDSDKPDEDELYIPCDIPINPVKGISFGNLKKGDTIYARVDDIPTAMKDKVEVREALREIEKKISGEKELFPAKLISGRSTGSRKVELTLEITPDVVGKGSCSRDVSILVPEETAEKRSGASTGGGLSEETKVALGIVVLVIFFLFIAVLGWFYLF